MGPFRHLFSAPPLGGGAPPHPAVPCRGHETLSTTGCDHTRLLNDRPSARPSLTSQLAGRLRARNSAPGVALESFNPLTPALGNETYRKRRVFTVFER